MPKLQQSPQMTVTQLIVLADSGPGLTRTERQDTLKNRWGFNCTCSMCAAPAEEVEKSDQRRVRIKELNEEVQSLISRERFQQAINRQEEMLGLIEKEKLTSLLWENHWLLATLYSDVGDQKKTIRYAMQAYNELKDYAKGGTEMIKDIEQVEAALKTLQ